MAEDYRDAQWLSGRFASAGPDAVIDMWESGTNEKGRLLSKAEGQALIERWHEIFGCLPPSVGSGTAPGVPPSASAAMPADDTMLRIGEVLRLTSLSLSTLKRYVADGAFPKPVKLSPRRNGWKAGAVKAWLAEREAASDYPTSRTDRQHRGRLN